MEVSQSDIEAAEKRGRELLPNDVAPDAYWGRVYALRKLPYRKYLKTPEWREKRREKLASVGFKCQLCNRGGGLEVHHRTYKDLGCEALSDLTVLCRSCHGNFHDKQAKDKRKKKRRGKKGGRK